MPFLSFKFCLNVYCGILDMVIHKTLEEISGKCDELLLRIGQNTHDHLKYFRLKC